MAHKKLQCCFGGIWKKHMIDVIINVRQDNSGLLSADWFNVCKDT